MLVVSCAMAAGALASDQATQTYPFRIETRELGKEYRLVAMNGGAATIMLSARIQGDNFASDRNWPIVEKIPPNSTLEIARVFAAVSGKDYRFSTRYSHGFGDVSAKPDTTAAYRLPFADGVRALVGQSYGGSITTHTGKDSLFAVDFTVPELTPIVAARGGKVIEVIDRFTEGGQKPSLLDKANVVTVQHDDGTTAHYVHLATKSASVTSGQFVTQGQLLGYSGNTGYSSGPHLHFAVTRTSISPDGTLESESIPVSFYADPIVRFEAKQNMVVVANYAQHGQNDHAQRQQQNGTQKLLLAPSSTHAIPTSSEDTDISMLDGTSAIELSWMNQIERQTGYPLWASVSLLLACIVLIYLLVEFIKTLNTTGKQI